MKSRAIVFAIVLLASCSTFATHEEYSSYRATRMTTEERDRLVALQQYAEHYPGGMWAGEVAQARREREDSVWGDSNTTREGLEWYLSVYPDGQYVEQARPRLAALQSVSGHITEEHAHVEQLQAQREEQRVEARRTWVTRAVQFWVRTLVSVRNYGSPIGQVARGNPEFSRAFGQAPAPECSPGACIKHYGQVFHIPVPGGTRIDRHIDVYLRLNLDHGRVERAELILPNKGFSRWYEMENGTSVEDADPSQRQTALNWALERIQPLLREVATGARMIDFVPDAPAPLPQDLVAQATADTEAAPSEPNEPAQPQQPQQPQPQQAHQDDGSIDDLLRQAVGPDEGQPTPQPTQPEAQPEQVETMVLPVGLIAMQYNNVRIVVFAAGDEDYGSAYDGIFIERIR